MDTFTLVVSVLSATVAITTLITFFANARKNIKAAAAEETEEKTKASISLDYIKLQNETIIAGNRNIAYKLDDQNARLTRLETTVANSNLAELPSRVAACEESVKSAHKRIDRLHYKDEGED